MPKCNIDAIAQFTPVAAFRNGVIVPGTAGVLTECLPNHGGGFMV